MKSPKIKHEISKHCMISCNCYQTQKSSFPNSFDHQNSSTFQYDFATATTCSLYPHTLFSNHESLPSLRESFDLFTRSYPQYVKTIEADEIREKHYSNLSVSSHVCLDYIGHALFSFSQKQSDHELDGSCSKSGVTQFGICCKSQEFESKLKVRIMSYLNFEEDDDYSVFFTTNQTSAFRVLAEVYPFESNRNLVTVYDHENEGVEAMIEGSKVKGARVSNAEFKWPKLKIHGGKLEDIIKGGGKNKESKKNGKGLFVFPLQSRVCGARYSYQWMNIAQQNGWHVLLDASGLGPKDMDTLGLSMFKPDFLICTFYKVFGEDPSGFSCLFVKKSIDSILTQSDLLSKVGIASLVDTSNSKFFQTLRYEGEIPSDVNSNLNSIELECRALDHADSLGLILIGNRTRCLINWLVNALQTLTHPYLEKGVQLVTIYGPKVRFDRGTTLAFNIFDWKGEKVDPLLVQKLADRHNVSLGCGHIKNVWFSERYESDKAKVLEKKSREDEGSHKGKKLKGKSESVIGVVMASLGFLNNFEDVYKLWGFVARFLDADFVEKERWRYTALNQRIIEV